MKAQYDKRAQSRELKVGILVLVRTPNLSGKLDDLWDGPFKITRKISSVTYELAGPDRRSRRRMAHINMLKAWNPPDASLLGMLIVDEEEDEGQGKCKVLAELPALMGRQNDEVRDLLAEYNDVVRQEVGRARDICHEIDTGNEKPIRSCPYRLVPAWRDQLREEVRVLQESGTVVPSTSPWSSPMVQVRKPDGTFRQCIDFRKSHPHHKTRPYLMPRIDEMIDQLGEAHYLSKLDLNKGFYQIPLAQVDQEKTDFCTPWGKFHFTMMPLGLWNAPASFQK